MAHWDFMVWKGWELLAGIGLIFLIVGIMGVILWLVNYYIINSRDRWLEKENKRYFQSKGWKYE